jgi:adenosylmethionine-8-amino-7-oxononanoate aminotransferase
MAKPGAMPGVIDHDTKDLRQKDRDHFLHPWTHYPSLDARGCLVLSEGEGAYVYDTDGKRYLDGIGGLWCVNVGYGREEIARAMADQARRLAFYNTFVDTTNPPAAQLSAKLAEIAPAHLNAVAYSGSGSGANETAIRLIHHYWNRLGRPSKKQILTRWQAYHGSTYLTASLSGKREDKPLFDFVPGLVHHLSPPNTYRRPDGTTPEQFCDQLVDELEHKILALGPENVGAFIAEPLLGTGGVLVPPPGYHRRTQEICRRYEVLTIADEVVTGFGRLGHMLASEPIFELEPDMISLAKGITSGYVPLAATLVSDRVVEVLRIPHEENAFISHGFTWSGHPVCCAAALANIEILERERICEHVREVGPYFEEELATLLDLPIVGDVRGSHFMLCVENVADRETKALLPNEADIGQRIADHCQERGLLVRPVAHLNILSPPLILTRDEIDSLVSILRESILATMDDLAREQLWSGP